MQIFRSCGFFRCGAHFKNALLKNTFFICVLATTAPAFAIEESTVLGLNLRAQKTLPADFSLEGSFTSRSNEVFTSHERKIAELKVSRSFGTNEISAAYNYQFDRNGQPGAEYRFWQQIRHQFGFDNSFLESSVRIEERYFTANSNHGNRLRVLNRWNKPISDSNVWRLGYEWMMNLDTISANTLSGVSQNRLITSIQHRLPQGRRIELEYQMRYIHVAGSDNRIQHQFQLQYALNL